MKTKIKYISNKKIKAIVRDFEIMTDLPEKRNGENTAPTPTELFVAAFGSCVASYISNYITNVVKVSAEGLSIDIDWTLNEDPKKVNDIHFTITLPQNEKINKRKPGIITVAKHCTIHNTIADPPEITFSINK